MEPVIKYIDKKNSKKLKSCIKRYYSVVSKDERIKQEYFHGNTQWEFFSPYYKEQAEGDCRVIADWIVNNFPDVKKTISAGEIHHFLQHSIFYRLTFRTAGMLIPVEEKKEGKSIVLTFQPRDVNLKTALSDGVEMEHLIAFFDQAVAGMVHHYKTHRSLAVIETANLKIDDGRTDEFIVKTENGEHNIYPHSFFFITKLELELLLTKPILVFIF